jgi:hypothetical protein
MASEGHGKASAGRQYFLAVARQNDRKQMTNGNREREEVVRDK